MTDGQDFEQNGNGIRQKNRIFDFITIDGLERLTGQTPDKFILFMKKELVDNALDKEGVYVTSHRVR